MSNDNPARQDQIDAASRDAVGVVTAVAATDSAAEIDNDYRPSAWFAERMVALGAADRAGQLVRCVHLKRTWPQPALLALHAPRHLDCLPCASARLLRSTAGDTCDRCRQLAQPLTQMMVAAGPILLAYMLCPPCWDAEQPEATS